MADDRNTRETGSTKLTVFLRFINALFFNIEHSFKLGTNSDCVLLLLAFDSRALYLCLFFKTWKNYKLIIHSRTFQYQKNQRTL